MQKTRENNYDLLRVIACFAVMMIHVSGQFYKAAELQIQTGAAVYSDFQMIMAATYHAISHFAVPCFLMISGAFILSSPKTAEYRSFYKNRFFKIILPGLIFCGFYMFYRYLTAAVQAQTGIDLGRSGLDAPQLILFDFFSGRPFYHLWYICVLFFLYLMAPFLSAAVQKFRLPDLTILSLLFFAWGIFSSNIMISKARVFYWSTTNVFGCAGYFLLGYCIYQHAKKQTAPHPKRAVPGFCGAAVLLLISAYLHHRELYGTVYGFDVAGHVAPLTAAASVLLFYGFACLPVRKNFAKLSSLTYYSYLIHAGILDFTIMMLRLKFGADYCNRLNPVWAVPLFSVLLFIVTIPFSMIALRIQKSIEQAARRHAQRTTTLS